MAQPKQAEWDLYKSIAEKIARDKRTIIGVMGSNKERGFSYTIGNQEKQLPELLIIGAWGEPIAVVLNEMSDMMISRKGPFLNGEEVSFGGQYPVRVFDAKDPLAKSAYCIQAGRFYDNEDYAIQQVVMCDKKGRWPDDLRCHKDFKVPLLKSAIILSS